MTSPRLGCIALSLPCLLFAVVACGRLDETDETDPDVSEITQESSTAVIRHYRVYIGAKCQIFCNLGDRYVTSRPARMGDAIPVLDVVARYGAENLMEKWLIGAYPSLLAAGPVPYIGIPATTNHIKNAIETVEVNISVFDNLLQRAVDDAISSALAGWAPDVNEDPNGRCAPAVTLLQGFTDWNMAYAQPPKWFEQMYTRNKFTEDTYPFADPDRDHESVQRGISVAGTTATASCYRVLDVVPN